MHSIGGIELPYNAISTPHMRNVSTVIHTYGGTRKERIRGLKTDFTITMPDVSAAYFNSLKALKEAQEPVEYIKPDEGGGDDLHYIVAIPDLIYDHLMHTSKPVIKNFAIRLEEI